MYTHIKSVMVIISLLKQYGISHIVVSPGTRNTAFSHSVECDPFFTCYSIVDERSAAYFALGIAEQLGIPVVVSCTAATATCNYFPAIKEAYERNIPLIALTADQDFTTMFHMEDQCIDQHDMYHGYVKCAIDIPKVLNDQDYWYCNRRVNEALIAASSRTKGPVQINYHMNYSTVEISTYDVQDLPTTRKINIIERLDTLESFSRVIERKQRILIVGGSYRSSELGKYISAFFQKCNCVVVCETYTNLRGFEFALNPGPLGDVISDYQIDYLKPDLIISFGDVYYSTIKYFIPRYADSCEHWQIAEDGVLNDGYRCLSTVFIAKPEVFFQRISSLLKGRNDYHYYDIWKKRIDLLHFEELPFSNLSVIKMFCNVIPRNALLHTTVLDSIRMSNYVGLPDYTENYANTGADGIDGALSTFLGQAQVHDGPAFLLIGDLCILYDMNALLQTFPANVHILVVNNHAGAEFYKNFGKDRIASIDNLVAAGHSISIKDACIQSQFKYLSAKTETEFREQLDLFVNESNHPILFEVFTDAEIDALTLKMFWNSNRQAIPGTADTSTTIKNLARKILPTSAIAVLAKIKNGIKGK